MVIAACSNPGTAVIVLTSIGAILVVEYAYPKVKEMFDTTYLAQQAYYAQLPQCLKDATPLEWVREERPMEKFGRTYGPPIFTDAERSLDRQCGPLAVRSTTTGVVPMAR